MGTPRTAVTLSWPALIIAGAIVYAVVNKKPLVTVKS